MQLIYLPIKQKRPCGKRFSCSRFLVYVILLDIHTNATSIISRNFNFTIQIVPCGNVRLWWNNSSVVVLVIVVVVSILRFVITCSSSSELMFFSHAVLETNDANCDRNRTGKQGLKSELQERDINQNIRVFPK